jgi:hypothetical protein
MTSNFIKFGKRTVALTARQRLFARKSNVLELILVEVGKRPQGSPIISPSLE